MNGRDGSSFIGVKCKILVGGGTWTPSIGGGSMKLNFLRPVMNENRSLPKFWRRKYCIKLYLRHGSELGAALSPWGKDVYMEFRGPVSGCSEVVLGGGVGGRNHLLQE